MNDDMNNLNKQLDKMIQEENKFKKKIENFRKKEVKNDNGNQNDEFKQSENN